MEKFNDGNYVFDITNEFSDGYEIWAIGRRNFKHKGYVPLCEVDESRYVKRDTLKALKVKDEALVIIGEYGCRSCECDIRRSREQRS